MMKNVPLSSLIKSFDVFFLDQFGTLHDGVAPYPGAVGALQRIRAAGKQVVILSNSGKSAEANARRFVKIGFPKDSFDQFVTSGEVAVDLLMRGALNLPLSPRTRCFTISRDGDTFLADRLGLEAVETADHADLIVISGSQAHRISLDTYREMLRPAAEAGVPAICTNPDIMMLTPQGLAPAAGSIAKIYEALGGTVSWVGKPHRAMYEYAYRICGAPPKDRIVAIGDSMEHDIFGAQRFGISSVLIHLGVSSGIARKELESVAEKAGLGMPAILERFS